jgi:hypothetical protein
LPNIETAPPSQKQSTGILVHYNVNLNPETTGIGIQMGRNNAI